MLSLAALGTLAQSILAGIVGPLLGYLGKRQEVQLETSRIRASANSWIGARIINMVAGLPAAMHFGAVMLDSTFQFGWGIPKVPAPYDGYEWAIVQSFFIVAPAMPLVSATSAWLSRKR